MLRTVLVLFIVFFDASARADGSNPCSLLNRPSAFQEKFSVCQDGKVTPFSAPVINLDRKPFTIIVKSGLRPALVASTSEQVDIQMRSIDKLFPVILPNGTGMASGENTLIIENTPLQLIEDTGQFITGLGLSANDSGLLKTPGSRILFSGLNVRFVPLSFGWAFHVEWIDLEKTTSRVSETLLPSSLSILALERTHEFHGQRLGVDFAFARFAKINFTEPASR